jgi:hypothetical protein
LLKIVVSIITKFSINFQVLNIEIEKKYAYLILKICCSKIKFESKIQLIKFEYTVFSLIKYLSANVKKLKCKISIFCEIILFKKKFIKSK